ncbi:MAG: C39 family peptidase [Nitrospirae bacterium]|nr:C39 family peptidase [Nitrospirota bacterium]
MPLYKQCASPWGADIYDHTTSTICKKGCALTSAVMVLQYYGVTTGIDGKEVNQGNLNDWLITQPDGYYKGNISWGAITRYSGNRVIFDTMSGRNDTILSDDLCNGNPVIVNVPNHFVVATGSMCAGNETTWTINDPGRNITTLQGYGNTYLGLRRTRFQ